MDYVNRRVLSVIIIFNIVFIQDFCSACAPPPPPPPPSSGSNAATEATTTTEDDTEFGTITRKPNPLLEDEYYYGGDNMTFEEEQNRGKGGPENREPGAKEMLGLIKKNFSENEILWMYGKPWSEVVFDKKDESNPHGWEGWPPGGIGAGPSGSLNGFGGWGPGSGPGGEHGAVFTGPGEWTPDGWRFYQNGEWGGPGGGKGGWGPGGAEDKGPALSLVLDSPPDGGKPKFCYEPVDSGVCTSGAPIPQKRWYYDVDQEDCFKFTFSGCGGNKNNFVKPLDCLKSCDHFYECCGTAFNKTDY